MSRMGKLLNERLHRDEARSDASASDRSSGKEKREGRAVCRRPVSILPGD